MATNTKLRGWKTTRCQPMLQLPPSSTLRLHQMHSNPNSVFSDLAGPRNNLKALRLPTTY